MEEVAENARGAAVRAASPVGWRSMAKAPNGMICSIGELTRSISLTWFVRLASYAADESAMLGAWPLSAVGSLGFDAVRAGPRAGQGRLLVG